MLRSCLLNSVVTRRFLSTTTYDSHRAFKLSGIYPPVVTPFDPQNNEAVDYAKFEILLRNLQKTPISGFVIFGSNGEFPMLNRVEKVEVIKFARKTLGKEAQIIAGAGTEATRDAVQLSQMMAASGADALLVYNPFYYRGRMTTTSYVKHFTKIADNSPIPVILYNVPAVTGKDIPLEVVKELAQHSNIVGIKDSGGDITRISNLCKFSSESHSNFQVVAGSAGFLLPALSVGCVGGIVALANVLPEEVCRLVQLYNEGNMVEAKNLQLRLVEPNTAITSGFGVPGLKAILRSLRAIDTGCVRSPLQDLFDKDIERIKLIFHQNGFHSPREFSEAC